VCLTLELNGCFGEPAKSIAALAAEVGEISVRKNYDAEHSNRRNAPLSQLVCGTAHAITIYVDGCLSLSSSFRVVRFSSSREDHI
jgi:hypothetical protein